MPPRSDATRPWYLAGLFQVLMLVHYFRRRPDGYWFFIIILGPIRREGR